MLHLHEKVGENKETDAVEKYSFNLIKNISLDKIKGDCNNKEKEIEDNLNERINKRNVSYFEW